MSSNRCDRWNPYNKRSIWITLAIAGTISGRDLYVMVETAIALSVAAVREGLPIVATVALARGMGAWQSVTPLSIVSQP